MTYSGINVLVDTSPIRRANRPLHHTKIHSLRIVVRGVGPPPCRSVLVKFVDGMEVELCMATRSTVLFGSLRAEEELRLILPTTSFSDSITLELGY